VESLSLKRLMP